MTTGVYMAPQSTSADAVRTAVTSTSFCTAATVASLKTLLGFQDAPSTGVGAKSRPQPSKGARSKPSTSQGRTIASSKAGQERSSGLSEKERNILAVDVLNAGLRALGEAAKPPVGASPSRKVSATDVAKPAPRQGPRRSNSAPMALLQPRSLNRISTCPPEPPKPAKLPLLQGSSTGCLATVECVRLALQNLGTLQDGGKAAIPRLELATGRSSFVSKLIGLGMWDQAAAELRVLKQLLHDSSTATKVAKTTARKPATESSLQTRSVHDSLDFGDTKATGKALNLVIATQLHALKILSGWKRPAPIESALPFLRSECGSSPVNLIMRYSQASPAEREKAARQLQMVSGLLQTFCPKPSTQDDEVALEPRLSVSPSVALELQGISLEAKVHCRVLTGRDEDIDQDMLRPLSRVLSTYIRRNGDETATSYKLCERLFSRLYGMLESTSMMPPASSKSPVAAIYGCLGLLARKSGQVQTAVSWVQKTQDLLDPQKDTAARCCSVTAELLSLHLMDPSGGSQIDTLLPEILEAIRTPLRGDVSELDELLQNLSLVQSSALNLWLRQTKTETSNPHRISASTKQLLETFISQYPSFCVRWVGKPPASKSSTKDFLRYEQRRQVLSKSIHRLLGSALLVIKTLIDEKRAEWTATDSVLANSLVLLEYLGDPKAPASTSGSTTSYYVTISSLYYMMYLSLNNDAEDSAKSAALKAIRQSIDCVKYQSKEEKEKAQVIVKMERMAELCRMMGRGGDALGSLQSVRATHVEDGALDAVTNALASQPPDLAWASNSKAVALSRTLMKLAKLEPVYLDWTSDRSELEQAAVLEHRLWFLLPGSSKPQHEVTLAHPCVESLLRIYYPTQFPVRRLRTLLRILSINLDNRDLLADIQPQIQAAIGLIERADLSDDSSLSEYVPYYRMLYASLFGLSEGRLDPLVINQCLSTWDGLVSIRSTGTASTCYIDNVPEFLKHLQSVADLARTLGQDTILTATLELMAKCSRTLPQLNSEGLLKHDSQLATQYASIGYYSKAEEILSQLQVHIQGQDSIPFEDIASFHLSFAEYSIATGAFDNADQHLAAARAADDAARTKGKESLIAHASLLQSFVSLEKGSAHHSLCHSKHGVGILFKRWLSLQKALGGSNALAQAADNDISLATDETSTDSQRQDDKARESRATASPQFWALLPLLFRSTLRVSSIYAHLGLFRETVYYAEQARTIASSTDAAALVSQSESWLSTVWLKASKPDMATTLLDAISSRIESADRNRHTISLACEMSSMYGDLKDYEKEAEMMELAEDALQSVNAEEKGKPTANGTSGSAGSEQLEDKMTKLSLEDKPIPPPTRKRAAAGGRRGLVKAAITKATKSKPAAAKPQPSPETVAPSSLEAVILAQKVSSLLNKQEWTAAMALLQRAGLAPSSTSAMLKDRFGLAVCILGQTSEMTGDAVFSVMQESTLAFPSVSGSAVDRDRSSVGPPPARGGSKERGAKGFVEKLVEARDYLVEAHSMAALGGDAGLLHRISGMLQSTVILLSAASSTKARIMGHPGYAAYSVETARNLTWRRERRAGQMEKSWQKGSADWPATATTPDARRTSLGFATDMNRLQRDYVDMIPKHWSVVSISLSDDKRDFCISKLQAGHSPFVIRLPLERSALRDADDEDDIFSFTNARQELMQILDSANTSSHAALDATTGEDRSTWWAHRDALDDRLRDFLARMEEAWLGGFRGILSRHHRRSDLLARFHKSFQNVLDKHLPSRRQVAGKRRRAAAAATATSSAAAAKVTLDPRVLELFVGLGDATAAGCDFNDALMDLLDFVVDILQFHGERNASDEIDFPAMVVETFDALHSYHTTLKSSAEPVGEGQHTILVLDKALHVFPWESLPCMRGLAVSRVPSLACLRDLLLDQRAAAATSDATATPNDAPPLPDGHRASAASGSYMLNPSSDLKSTQARFYKPLLSLGSGWGRIISRAPSEAEFEAALAERDVLLYFGHGSGEQYITSRRIRRLHKCRAAALLMGCRSASLAYNGDFEVHGPAWNYMQAGCPAVVGTLWDVTDRDVDRFAGRLLEEWGLLARGSFEEEGKAGGGGGGGGGGRGAGGAGGAGGARGAKGRRNRHVDDDDASTPTSLVEAVSRAREAPRYRYLTAAAVVVYGIPVYLTK